MKVVSSSVSASGPGMHWKVCELGGADLASSVKSGMKLFEERISARLQKAKAAGELPATFQAEISAQIIFTFLQGYFRVIKVLKPCEQMWEQVETLLTKLGL